MSLAENVETLPQPRGGNYEFARFNALRHGVLSQHTVLPWEDPDEYRELVEALAAEHQPQGPTEEHLLEELAGIIWRKRRLRLGENAAHHRALSRAADPYQHTAEAALISVAENVEPNCIGDAIRATDEQTTAEIADLEEDRAMTEEALRILASSSPSAYSRALAALRDDTRGWWRDRLSGEPEDSDQEQTPYTATTESLKRFIEDEVAPLVRPAPARARASLIDTRAGIRRSRRSEQTRAPRPL
jgi:hypothetical protein